MLKANIIGLGSYLPERILSNSELEKMVDTSDEWIFSRTGMRERRIASDRQAASDLGFKASLKAIREAKIKREEIDFILVATMTPDFLTPSTAAIIQAQLGAINAAVLDVQAACAGFLYALAIAKSFVESGLYRNVLVVGAEKLSSFVDYRDRSTCVLFGDGAAAALVSDRPVGLHINSVALGADGTFSELIKVPGGGSRYPASPSTIEERMHYIKMRGKETFKHAVRQMEKAAKECLREAAITLDGVSWLVPHQANERIIDALAKKFRLPADKVIKTIHKYGNTSSPSLMIALDELKRAGKIGKGEHILLVAFGAGLCWGAGLLTRY